LSAHDDDRSSIKSFIDFFILTKIERRQFQLRAFIRLNDAHCFHPRIFSRAMEARVSARVPVHANFLSADRMHDCCGPDASHAWCASSTANQGD
jgi:hypothetical protein